MVKLAGAIQYLVVSIALVVCGLYDITSEIGLVESEIAQGITDKIQGNEIITNGVLVLNKNIGEGNE